MSSKSVGKVLSGQKGFTLVELSLVLVIIGIIIAAVTITSQVQRSAEYTSVFTRFVSSWASAYQTYFDYTGRVLEDTVPATGQVNGSATTSGTKVCGRGTGVTTTLLTAITAAGIELPAGRGRGYEDLAIYLASDGSPQQLSICFRYLTNWPTSLGTQPANVMEISGLTAEFAKKIDAMLDVNSDAAWGVFRNSANYTSTTSVSWPDATNSSGVINIVTAYYRMPY